MYFLNLGVKGLRISFVDQSDTPKSCPPALAAGTVPPRERRS